ncbi:helix-turn-helix domain-containing protein [Actinokineospora sp. 24-640]
MLTTDMQQLRKTWEDIALPAPMKRIATTKRSLARLAAQLRQLWDSAPVGRPSIAQIAKSGQASRAAIYAAMSGRVLPSRNTLQAMVIAWSPGAEADVPVWMAFRARCADEMSREPPGRPDSPPGPILALDHDAHGDLALSGGDIRQMRLTAGCSLTQLARGINYSKGYLSRLENGHRPVPPSVAQAVRRFLAFPVDDTNE